MEGPGLIKKVGPFISFIKHSLIYGGKNMKKSLTCHRDTFDCRVRLFYNENCKAGLLENRECERENDDAVFQKQQSENHSTYFASGCWLWRVQILPEY
ncbi:hypothetical protein SDC9_94103 [bioreactor metagenome]|uniref:Uncharacterized protein n=1 Tax=bioreactor metagenome TaxID=1076179 RepID=A0A645A961_9ZZZZ